ncbi:MAG: S46 family peptidase [Saprospiraceae bacterium]|jgi:hypothetical protein|nr:S46 family peptidase [Saprospiraceae bacterium]MBK7797404.1 S46 family peptidase [Saprospiraceae bacterium]MBK8153129.1 S46 family peptidase [Saprospiraceae bacterium]MBX7163753.1 S46 family peptidase [Saprospiraceae bacterium]
MAIQKCRLYFTQAIVYVFIFIQSPWLWAGEGMWLPLLLKSLNEKEMQNMGMKMSADDIYNVNKGSLKDAIVHFGGGCTSEIISSQGLLLTNHHCGYGYITGHSSVEKNYLKDGFWAATHAQELRCAGLTATLLVRMEDITSSILKDVSPTSSEENRKSKIDENISVFRKSFKLNQFEELLIRQYYNGNQYFALVTTTYQDVRLVGSPPESIGKFGADTDNWVWPRHTGDFSLFRIYAGGDNMPAEYSEDNKPYIPKHFLPISLDGIQEGDFTMVFGYPGRTNEYLTQEGMRQIVEVQNPIRISCRDKILQTMDKYMRTDASVKIQYAAQYASIANAWKKWIGENQGIKFTKGLEKKLKFDNDFQSKINSQTLEGIPSDILQKLKEQYLLNEPYLRAKESYAEAFQRSSRIYENYSNFQEILAEDEKHGKDSAEKLKSNLAVSISQTYSGFNPQIEKEIFALMLAEVQKNCPSQFIFPALRTISQENFNNYTQITDKLVTKSALFSANEATRLLNLPFDSFHAALKLDPLYQFYDELNYFVVSDIIKNSTEYENNISILRRQHMDALMRLFPEKRFYPDANSTLRVTYGNVSGFYPRDGACYQAQTYLDGVVEKYIPGDYEFDVHPKLLDLYKKKDYGIYGENGKMPLAFIASNHTTGGNSGSPAIDAYGNLIGLNFDRVWEGTMSDINYDQSICRNIMVDARYILFIIDKFAGAGQLIQEMKLTHPKSDLSKKSRSKNKR